MKEKTKCCNAKTTGPAKRPGVVSRSIGHKICHEETRARKVRDPPRKPGVVSCTESQSIFPRTS
jgi:hypothetical protein